MTKRLVRQYGSSPYTLAEPEASQLGVPYRRASDREPVAVDERVQIVDIAELDRATRRHMQLQDRVADELLHHGVEPRSPDSWEPQFDLAFEHAGVAYVVEAKTSNPVALQQVRIGVGQVLEYCELLGTMTGIDVRAVLLIETELPDPWERLSERLGIAILRADDLERSLAALFNTQ